MSARPSPRRLPASSENTIKFKFYFKQLHQRPPDPPGFTLTTDACREFIRADNQLPAGQWQQTMDAMDQLGEKTGKQFSNPDRPLLVSVRSGGKFSMPGMMDTVLNLGLTDDAIPALAKKAGERYAWDTLSDFSFIAALIPTGTKNLQSHCHPWESPVLGLRPFFFESEILPVFSFPPAAEDA